MSSSNGSAKDLTVEDYCKVLPRVITKVYVPALGGNAYLRSLRPSEKERWERERVELRGNNVRLNEENTRSSLLRITICSKDGRLLEWTDEQIKNLEEQDVLSVELLYRTAREMNGLDGMDVESLNLPKNSARVPVVSSGDA